MCSRHRSIIVEISNVVLLSLDNLVHVFCVDFLNCAKRASRNSNENGREAAIFDFKFAVL